MSNDIPQVIVNNLYPNKIAIQMTDDLLINEKEKENVTTSKFNKGRWNSEEHKKFIVGILEYGNDWKKVQKLIKTRSSTQARSHAQKFFLRIKNDLKIKADKSILLNNVLMLKKLFQKKKKQIIITKIIIRTLIIIK